MSAPDLVLISPCSGAVRRAAPAGVEAVVHSLAAGLQAAHEVHVVATPDSELPAGARLHPCRHADLPAEISRMLVKWPRATFCDHSGAAIDEQDHAAFYRIFHVEPRYVFTPARPQRCAFVSSYLRGVFAAQRGPDFASYPVLENGIPIPLRRDALRTEIVYVGRLNRLKGVDLGVAACARLGRSLQIHGGFGRAAPADIVFNDLGLLDELDPVAFAYHGPLRDEARKADVLARAAAVLVPSREAESCSLVALEAVAASAPVVTFRRGGVVEYLGDHPGVFFAEYTGRDEDDSLALSVALRRAVGSPARAGLPARYTASAMVERYRAWLSIR